MSYNNTYLLFHVFSYILLCAGLTSYGFSESDNDRKLHIVYMGALPAEQMSLSSIHATMLQQLVGTRSLENILMRSYTRSFNGFAAYLKENEIQLLSNMEEVVSIFPSRTLHQFTTRSWDFVGMTESIKRRKTIESNTIIGVIDGGIWPEAESFRDEGFDLPPRKWKGVCNGGKNFTCNNKLIGARYYDITSPITSTRDEFGHGTHTASTAAGNYVNQANFKGLAKGMAKGGVPSARIAAYSVCLPSGTCGEADILAAFDDAIADGVDIITISLGGTSAARFEVDPIAIGAFHAMEKGILTTQAAGNYGPDLKTSPSAAPWVLSVAASTTDRLFVDKVVLGNGKEIIGFSINPFSMDGRRYPLVYDKDVKLGHCTSSDNDFCYPGCLDPKKVKGKIVLCQNYDGSVPVTAAGVIRRVDPEEQHQLTDPVSFPKVSLDTPEFDLIHSYINSTKNPKAEILKSETVLDSTAPIVGYFSSRGPNVIIPQILKPDISAPGVNILAAFSPYMEGYKFHILSGTSMACPHVAGVAAYVKTFHSTWSPSAIKSAIMTTARVMDSKANEGKEFAYGSGHINPAKATQPGLVYETEKSDYIKMLCSYNISDKLLKTITGDHNITCPKHTEKISWKDLNYPSMAINVTAKKHFEVTFNRTVTNVGHPNSIYKAKVTETKNLSIKVEPDVLSFKGLSEKKSFVVTVSGYLDGLIMTSSLIWSDGKYSVRSPVVVYDENIE